MPELPEVEIARRNLLRWFDGRRVIRAEADRRARTFRGADPALFEKIEGRLEDASRHGKYLLLAFESGRGALAHLGMTGKFVRRPEGHPEPYSRARFHLDDGQVIHYRDPRLFGRIEPVASSDLRQLPVVRALGIDPMVDGLTARSLARAVGGSKQDLKVALMDQSRIAGLGNIHAAEALFRARLHPARKPATLRADEWRRLARAIRATLRFALESEESEEIEYVEEPGSANPFKIYGRAGERCPRCGTKVQSFTQGGRTTHFCPRCQPRKSKR
jgi:formamidopyrimidine-DNA glycosylase